jgi:hypothetical protein
VIGFQSLSNNIIGSSNVSVGRNALLNFNADAATAVGSYALDALTTGLGNTAIGYEALSANETGANCTGLGMYAMRLATGANNLGVGYGAGDAITTGTGNMIVGDYAGTTTLTNNAVICNGAGTVVFRYNGTNWFFGDGSSALPTSDPGVAGALWNNAGVLSVSP